VQRPRDISVGLRVVLAGSSFDLKRHRPRHVAALSRAVYKNAATGSLKLTTGGASPLCQWTADSIAIVHFTSHTVPMEILEHASWCAARAVILDISNLRSFPTTASLCVAASPTVMVADDSAPISLIVDGVFLHGVSSSSLATVDCAF